MAVVVRCVPGGGVYWRGRRRACGLTLRTASFLSSDRVEYRATHTSERERARTVAAYYNQPAIEAAAQKKSVRLTPSAILYHGRTDDEATTIVVSVDKATSVTSHPYTVHGFTELFLPEDGVA